MIAVITKEVTKAAVDSILPMFNKMRSHSELPSKKRPQPQPCDLTSYDWALHPGGAAILNGAQQTLHIEDDHIRASREVYTKNGNSSSVTVLIVLDRLRHMGRGRDDVVAASFGPGMVIEMCMLKRWRGETISQPLLHNLAKYSKWLSVKTLVAGCQHWSSNLRLMAVGSSKGGSGKLGL